MNDIIRGYKYGDADYNKINRVVNYIIQNSCSIEEVKKRIITFMSRNYLKNWQRTTDSLIFEEEFWKWLIGLKATIGFGLIELENRNKLTGYIGTYNGVRCYVEKN